jgi:soluble lytic murein transglycosylase-like protein
MGAWDVLYSKGLRAVKTDPIGYGIVAIKRDLAFNGFNGATKRLKPMDTEAPEIGPAADRAIRAFQKAFVLEVDGVVGPHTALALWRRRCVMLEAEQEIPDDLLAKLKSLESANDPGAVGVADPNDHGLVQINSVAHPGITLRQAFDAAWSLDYAAHSLRNAYDTMLDWDGAVAAWNTGEWSARSWVAAGKPPSFHLAGVNFDIGQRATLYVRLVRAAQA